jgi:hypothetical protein
MKFKYKNHFKYGSEVCSILLYNKVVSVSKFVQEMGHGEFLGLSQFLQTNAAVATQISHGRIFPNRFH